MRLTGGLLIIATSTLALSGCAVDDASPAERADYAAMLRVEQVPGVLVAPYANYIQIDPTAPEQDIVDTVLAVGEILVDLPADAPSAGDLTVIAIYPGDPYVETEFTTRVVDDAEALERDARTWASLLDEGFDEVRYNVFDDNGDGVLNVHASTLDAPGPSLSEAFDLMVGALDGPADRYAGLQTEALVGDVLATNRSGAPELPEGWGAALDAIGGLDYLWNVAASFDSDASSLRLTSTGEASPEQIAEIMAILTRNDVLQTGVTVTLGTSGASRVTLYGVAE